MGGFDSAVCGLGAGVRGQDKGPYTYKQIARRQSTASTVVYIGPLVSGEGPGRKTRQEDLCVSLRLGILDGRSLQGSGKWGLQPMQLLPCRALSWPDRRRQAFIGMSSSSLSSSLFLHIDSARYWWLFTILIVFSPIPPFTFTSSFEH